MDFDDLDEIAAERAAAGELDEVAAAALGIPEAPGEYKGGYMWPIPRNVRFPNFDKLPEKLQKSLDVGETQRGVRIRLFVFYGAGDSFPFWAQFMEQFPDWAEVAIYEWPRHGTREDEELPTHVDGMVADAMEGIRPALKQHAKDGQLEGAPFALCGHSIGVRIMLGVAERAKKTLGVEPAAVFIMDRAAPQYPLCSAFGLKLLEEDSRDFIRIFNPMVYNMMMKNKDKDKGKSEAMCQMWQDDIKFQNHTKELGFHTFKCDLHVFVAMENWCYDPPEVVEKLSHWERHWHFERCSILGSKEDSQALWDYELYEDWKSWTTESCKIHNIKVDHAALKRDKGFLKIVFDTLKRLRIENTACPIPS